LNICRKSQLARSFLSSGQLVGSTLTANTDLHEENDADFERDNV
jgi:hypothetical protein